jgi:hypothetical protein
LADFVAKLFCQESLNNSYPLIKDDGSSLLIPMPQDTTKNKYVEWVKQLPPNEKPTWLGLPDNAEKVLLISEGNRKHNMFTVMFFMLRLMLGSKFAVDLLKCDQSDESTLAIGKKIRCSTRKLFTCFVFLFEILMVMNIRKKVLLLDVQHG